MSKIKYFVNKYTVESYDFLENGDAFSSEEAYMEFVELLDTLEEAQEYLKTHSSEANRINTPNGVLNVLSEYTVEPTEVDDDDNFIDCFECVGITTLEHLDRKEFASTYDFQEFWKRGLTFDVNEDLGVGYKQNENGLWYEYRLDDEEE